MKASWDDYRYLLAVYQAGSVSGAASKLNVNESTVTRRLMHAEESRKVKLFERSTGKIVPTQLGLSMLIHLETIERSLRFVEERFVGANERIEGTVRISSIPTIVNHMLVPALNDLLSVHPRLNVELISSQPNLTISRNEVDIIFQLARPTTDQDALTRKIGEMTFGSYCSESQITNAANLSWIAYQEQVGSPSFSCDSDDEAGVTAESGSSRVCVSDLETALSCIQNGYGKSLLPDSIAARSSNIHKLIDEQSMSCEVWRLLHCEYRTVRRIDVVAKWASKTISEFLGISNFSDHESSTSRFKGRLKSVPGIRNINVIAGQAQRR